MLSDDQVAETADAIAARQRPDGRLPWHDEQHTDPWNHVEGAMGLHARRTSSGGRARVRVDGADAASGRIVGRSPTRGTARSLDADADTNMCAYIADGCLAPLPADAGPRVPPGDWPVVEKAIDYVLDHQAPGGEIAWMHHANGTIDRRSLLTASSSIYMSVRCAVAIAEEIGEERPDWELSIGLLAHAIAHRQEVFWPKPRWSMDWYYPVLTGVVRGRGRDGSHRGPVGHVHRPRARVPVRRGPAVGDDGRDVRARPRARTRPGDDDRARALFADVQFMRQDDGAYQEGWVFPKDVFWPGRTPPWTSGAVLLAADALDRRSPAWNLFRGDDLPTGLSADEVAEHLLGAGVEVKAESERTA